MDSLRSPSEPPRFTIIVQGWLFPFELKLNEDRAIPTSVAVSAKDSCEVQLGKMQSPSAAAPRHRMGLREKRSAEERLDSTHSKLMTVQMTPKGRHSINYYRSG